MTRDEEIRHDLERQWGELEGEPMSQHLLNPADFTDFLEIIKEFAKKKNPRDHQRSSGFRLRTPP